MQHGSLVTFHDRPLFCYGQMKNDCETNHCRTLNLLIALSYEYSKNKKQKKKQQINKNDAVVIVRMSVLFRDDIKILIVLYTL